MSEINLEKVDIIRDRTGVSYTKAKEALLYGEGDVLDAIIYLESSSTTRREEIFSSTEDMVNSLKELVKKGNINRIKIRKGEKVLLNVPVNAGVATGALGLMFTPLLAILGVGTMAAVFANFTIEITKTDGNIEVVNAIIKNTTDNVKDKINDIASEFKGKLNLSKESKEEQKIKEENVYKYTVKFDDMEEEQK